MVLTDLFKEYELLAVKADHAFQKMKRDYGPCIKCQIRCSDCCYAVFGLFLIESVYLKYHFDKLGRRYRREAILRGNKADEDLLKIEKKLQVYNNNPQMKAYAMGRERVRCSLLNDNQECMIYPFRPITCRVYGIPTVINGKIYVCWKTGFKKDQPYPAFNLDALYKDLYWLSCRLLKRAGQRNIERASLLLSVSRTIKTPIKDLINESFEQLNITGQHDDPG